MWFCLRNSCGSVGKYIFFGQMVMGSPETRISDSESIFHFFLIRFETESGETETKVSCCFPG